MKYINVISRNSHSVKILCSTGEITEITRQEFAGAVQVPLMEKILHSRPKRISDADKLVMNPENPLERIYLYKRSELPSHKDEPGYTDVVLMNNTVVSIPNEYLSTWYSFGDLYSYNIENLLQDYWDYHLGRTLGDLTFGIEFEFTAPKQCLNAFLEKMSQIVGNMNIVHKINENKIISTKQWVLKYDSSIQSPKGCEGYELTTPILHLTKTDAQKLRKVLDCIKKDFHGTVNDSCGTHIHIGNFAPLEFCIWYHLIHFMEEYTQYIFQKLDKYTRCYSRLERTVFDRLVSYSRRKNRNEFCQPCSRRKSAEDEGDRYFKINLCCLSQNNTIENRQHHGTLDFDEIWSWMILNGSFLLACLEDANQFDDVKDMNSLFDRISLPMDVRYYYSNHLSEIALQDTRNIEESLMDRPKQLVLPEVIQLGSIPAMRLCA